MAASAFDLHGKLAVVTGARRGIGHAFAVALARAGADVVGVSRELGSEGSAVQHAVEALGRDFIALRADLAQRSAVYELVGQLEGLGREVDILVSNAGTISRSDAVDHTDEEWDEVMAVNLTSQFLLARDLGRRMIARGCGKIIFTASLLSFEGGVRVPSYTASKSGLRGLTMALANEWAPLGVNVNAIAPGYIATDNTQALRDDPVRSRALLERIPAGRWGQPGDLEGAVVFLASTASDYVHGTVLPVDGGWLAR